MSDATRTATTGQAIYTKTVLSVYDLWVHGLSNHLVWGCPSSSIQALYDENISGNHLDVGVGTGYFLDRCLFPNASPRIALMDMNPNSLAHAEKRIRRYGPEIYQQNVLEPVDQTIEPFDSVGLNYLLHCVSGSISEKAVVFDHLATLMNPGASIFGATILQKGVRTSRRARALMALYNRQGIFSNREDNLGALMRALSERFINMTVDVEGCVALFSAEKPA